MSEHDNSKKPVTIYVNGTAHIVEKGKITFEQVVTLAFPTPPPGENIDYTVMYSRGAKDKPQGDLEPGQDVEVVEAMRFDVTPTDRS
jgi:hypothetical protein